jgi:hypothetical protein
MCSRGRARKRGVFEKGIPVLKAEVGGDEGGLFLVALLQQGEEEADLSGFDLGVPQFIDLC